VHPSVPANNLGERVERRNRDMPAVWATLDLRERFAELGIDPVASSPAAFARFLREEFEKYAKLIRAIGIQPE
jgi:tripartite-type tricarboxylate transporter receptor subunit TctC